MSENAVPWAFVTHLMYALKLDDKQCQTIGDVAAQWGADMFACHRQFARCESPMERLFVLAPNLHGCCLTGWAEVPETIDANALYAQHEASGAFVYLLPQFTVREDDDSLVATVDFRLAANGAAVLVEIDGHEFHEKTKEQVAHDKRRERRIVKCGHRILRFSGSEVWADPVACLNEAVEAVLAIASRSQTKVIQPAEQSAFERGYAHRAAVMAMGAAE